MRIYRLLIISLAVLSACKSAPVEEKPSPGGDSASGKFPVFYEANPKVFSSGGSIAAIKGRLGAIQALGTDILWLMPIQEFGKEKSVGSPYCIRDYKSVNSSYGTISDVKALVADAHGRGMKVILDWVANHTRKSQSVKSSANRKVLQSTSPRFVSRSSGRQARGISAMVM